MTWDNETDYSFADIHIDEDDVVLWKGKPEKGITASSHDLMTIPFGIFFTLFAIFWTAMAASGFAIMAVFGIPFILVGLYMLGGKYIINERMKDKTAYVITNKAIIRKRGNRVDIWYGSDLNNMKVFTHKNGTTSFVFSNPVINRGRTYRVSNEYFGIENVRDAKDVSEAIRKIER